ncbi:hypothetical protein Aple_025280 [Acrocarpospora pleiomorpha]|uniref:DUF3893 domain-containing protein n=1 Tax=Acrocarpospora pleiomorpha TaxID=90975 RepID=A0A5M3XFX1_9ACTN|nr:RNaseH domain-containing protein [Acrocarpospora pleiomorpha]GES19632.1 hypothetical protein Aple_025280 [Acrocarpospora pleiomorpha]
MGRRATARDLTAHTTAIHCTPKLLDGMSAVVWEFDKDTQNAWRALGDIARKNKKAIRGEREEDVFLIPYSIVVTVLQQYTDGYVYLDRGLRFMVTLAEVQPKILKKVFTFLEGIVSKVPLDEIPFTVTSRVADRIAATPAQRLPLAEYILAKTEEGVANPPAWAYEAVKWLVAKRLAAVPFVDQATKKITAEYKNDEGEVKEKFAGWELDNSEGALAEVRYRPASDGSLIAWDYPIGPPFVGRGHPIEQDDITRDWPSNPKPSQVQYAMSRLSIKMATYTAVDHPILNTDAHVRRVNNTLIHARTALVDQGQERPLLQVTLDGRGLRQTNAYALEILAKLDAERSSLKALEDRTHREQELWNMRDENGNRLQILTPPPGTVRPTVPKTPRWFPVGTGAGIYHLELLHKHIQRAFGDSVRLLELKSSGSIFTPRAFEVITDAEKKTKKNSGDYLDLVGLPSPASVQRSIEAAGYKTLRFTCLWYLDQTRMRMLHGLAHSYGIDPSTLDPADGDIVALAPGVEVVFHFAEALLAHGPNINRAGETQAILDSYGELGVLLAAWCETEVPTRGEEHQGMKPDQLEKELDDNDAKFQSKRTMAQSDMPTQYLIGRYHDGLNGIKIRTVPQKAYEDHRVFMGLLDIYRSCGIIDDRFEDALYSPDDAYPLARLAWCGIHIRKQATEFRYKGEPKRIVCATAIIPSVEPHGAWRMLGWSNLHPYWEHYPIAQARFHASNYPPHRADAENEFQRWTQAGHDVKLALQDLADELDGLPYALLLDGHACRRVWPGLHNNKQGRQPDPDDPRLWLPGTGLSVDEKPASIIRINCAQEELPRLAYVTVKQKNGTEKVIKTSSDLYYPADRPEGHSWFLYTEPRNYGKKRHGQYKSRWRAEAGKASDRADERKENELNSPWYAMTTREITPMYTQPDFDRAALAVATARLSHHALSWSDRTRYPAPLHAALQMDLDHPQFRRSVPKDADAQKILADATGENFGSEA